MATIEKLSYKNGVSYRISVSAGFDTSGRRIRHRMTYKPEPGMTARQIEKAVQRAAADFERSIEQGFALDNRQTFAEYADYVIDLKKRTGLRPKTEDRYRELLGRINPAIGHLKIADIRPQHLNSFYKNLGESGIRADEGTATAKIDLTAYLKSQKKTKTAVAEAVTNALIHGYEENPQKEIEMHCMTAGQKVHIEIIDRGKGIEDIEKAREPFYTTRPEWENAGMGISIMEAFMDSVSIESHRDLGTKIIMEKEIGTV